MQNEKKYSLDVGGITHTAPLSDPPMHTVASLCVSLSVVFIL